MTNYQKVTVIIFRIVAFFIIVYSVITLCIASVSLPFLGFQYFLVFLIPLILGILLYYTAPRIARLLTRDFGD
jgi:hypothetical protein